MENTIRVFYVVALRDKATGKIHIDTELVDSTSVENANEYLEKSFEGCDTELVTYRIGKLSSPREGVCWLKKS